MFKKNVDIFHQNVQAKMFNYEDLIDKTFKNKKYRSLNLTSKDPR